MPWLLLPRLRPPPPLLLPARCFWRFPPIVVVVGVEKMGDGGAVGDLVLKSRIRKVWTDWGGGLAAAIGAWKQGAFRPRCAAYHSGWGHWPAHPD